MIFSRAIISFVLILISFEIFALDQKPSVSVFVFLFPTSVHIRMEQIMETCFQMENTIATASGQKIICLFFVSEDQCRVHGYNWNINNVCIKMLAALPNSRPNRPPRPALFGAESQE